MQIMSRPVDMSKVRTVIYHMPDGQKFAVQIDGLEQFVDLRFGRICDTSDVDGIVHFFPRGNA